MANIPFNRGAIAPTQCISGGWDLIKNDYWLFLGIALVGWLIMSCLFCVSWFLAGPILAGIYYCLFKRMNGEMVEFGMMFKGFDKFVPTMVLGLIIILPEIILQILNQSLQITAQVLSTMGRENNFQAGGDGTSAAQTAIVTGIFGLIFLIYLIYLVVRIVMSISLAFTIPLVIEHDLSIMDAIKTSARAGWSNIGGLILLFILEALVGLAGALALCIGVFFVLPIIHAANAVAYRQVFPAPSQFTPTTPPAPDSFGTDYGSPNYGGQNYGGQNYQPL